MSAPYDAIIVGAGPAGASTAIGLAQRGFRVALLDRARFPREKACAEYVNPEAALVLERLGLLACLCAAGAVGFPGMRVISPCGHRLELDFDADAGRHALGISRMVMDQLAVEHCRRLGVEVVEGARVRAILRDGRSVTGVQASHRGQVLDIRGRVVVGADGHHSTVARLLELDRRVVWPRRIGLAAHLAGYPLDGFMGEMHVGADSYCGIAPQQDGRVNAAMVIEMQRFERRGCTVEQFFDAELRSYSALADRAGRAERVTPVRGVGPLARRVRRVHGDGVVLVGDAAGFFDPFTGEGIYDALRGGELAAAAIADALGRGDTSAAGLANYAAARRRAFAAKRRAAWLVQGFLQSPRLMDYAIVRIATRPATASTMTGVLGEYRDAGVVLTPKFLWGVLRP